MAATLARLRATGRGSFRARVVIEGWPFEIVSAFGDTGSIGDGRTRLGGLQTSGWVFSEKIDIVQAKLEVEGISVAVADIAGAADATQAFSSAPTATTYLDGDITAASTTITVSDTTAFASSGTIHIGHEAITYSGKTATTFTGCTRGAWRSLATYHYGPDAQRIAFTPVTDLPIHLEGRRVEFYLYDHNETISASDTPFWLGLLTEEPTFDGKQWGFQVDPITARLKQKIGSNLFDPVPIRGIYYPAAAPLTIEIVEFDSATVTTGFAGQTFFAMCGFWETQEAFCADLTEEIETQKVAAGGFTQTVRAEVDGDAWRIVFETHTSTPHAMRFAGLAPGFCLSMVDGRPNAPISVVAGTVYAVPMTEQAGVVGGGTVPRMIYGRGDLGQRASDYVSGDRTKLITYGYPGSAAHTRSLGLNTETYPPDRFYVGASRAITTAVTAAQVEWAPNGPGVAGFSATRDFIGPSNVDAGTSVGDRYIEIGYAGVGAALNTFLIATNANVPEIKLGRELARGTLASLITAITTNAPQYAPLGAYPMIRADEIGGGEIAAAAAGIALLNNRTWSLWEEADLAEVHRMDCRLACVCPALDANGAITHIRIRLPALAEAADHSLSDFQVRGSGPSEFFRYVRAPFGLINQWTLKTGYNPRTDEYEGPTVHVIDQESRGNSGRLREMVIEPKSKQSSLTPEEVFNDSMILSTRVLGVFGGPYETLICRVPLSHLDSSDPILCGQIVSLTWTKPPDGAGGHGMSAKLGYVIGRAIHLREAFLELTLLMTTQRVAGYAPGGKITSISGASGGTGPFTVTLSSDYFATGKQALDYWSAGDKGRVFKWGDSTPGTITFTLTSVAANQLTFTADSAWTHAGATWAVGFQASTTATSHMKPFGWIAESTATIDFDTDQAAQTFA